MKLHKFRGATSYNHIEWIKRPSMLIFQHMFTGLGTCMVKRSITLEGNLYIPAKIVHFACQTGTLYLYSIYDSSVLSLPSFYLKTERSTRHHHSLHFIQPHTNTYFSISTQLFPQSIKDWNYLPVSLIEINNHDLFLSELLNHFDLMQCVTIYWQDWVSLQKWLPLGYSYIIIIIIIYCWAGSIKLMRPRKIIRTNHRNM